MKKGDEGGFTIVFDNYHELPPNSPLHEIILNGLSRIPEGINVILISRSEPPPTFIRLRANHQMEILGWDELRLTFEESVGMIRLRSNFVYFCPALCSRHYACYFKKGGVL